MNDIRIIPFPGSPLEYSGSDSSRTVFSAPERGFLIGPENYALEPVVQWAVGGEVPEDRLPILFYGPCGSGRTHLLRGILEAWRKNQKTDAQRRRSFLFPAVDFARLFSDSLATKTTDDFRRRFRKAALLLIDDVEQLDDKPWAREELLHTLDALTKNGAVTVLTSDELPGRGGSVGDPLSARLLGGTTIPILLPGPEVRKRFLHDLASAFRLTLSDPALERAAKELALSIPALYGFFAQMAFEANAEGNRIDAVYLKRFLKERSKANRPGIDAIAKNTAKHFSLKLSDLRGSSRNKTVSLARSVAIYLARHLAEANLKEIAKYFNNRDPSTIRHSIEKIHRELSQDPTLRDHLFRLGLR